MQDEYQTSTLNDLLLSESGRGKKAVVISDFRQVLNLQSVKAQMVATQRSAFI